MKEPYRQRYVYLYFGLFLGATVGLGMAHLWPGAVLWIGTAMWAAMAFIAWRWIFEYEKPLFEIHPKLTVPRSHPPTEESRRIVEEATRLTETRRRMRERNR